MTGSEVQILPRAPLKDRNMTITPHLLSGAAGAVAITQSLPVAFLIGFFLHFIIDAIPHIDPGTFFWPGDKVKKQTESWPLWIYIFAASEFIIVWSLIILLFKNNPNFGIIMMGGLGGIAVDVLDNNPYRTMRQFPVFKQIHWLHDKMHYDLSPNKWYLGLSFQVVIIGVSLWYLLKF